jgi:UDP-GlcNAc:undecaprenyl-phosphate GlcNAc-1-phosphate transferase
MAHLFITALSAFLAAIVMTWLVRRAALALGVMDRPDGIRKLHRQPIPLLGGVGVFGAWLIGMIICLALERGSSLVSSESVSGEWSAEARIKDRGSKIEKAAASFVDPQSSILDARSPDHSLLTTHNSPDSHFGFHIALFLAAVVVLVSGALDDLLTLRPRWKLVGQTAAASVLLANGLIVKRIWLFGYTLELGWLGVVLTLVWLVGSMNAVNMLDGLDGLASTVGLVICGTLTWMACLTGHFDLALVSIALAGALGGFLLFNFPPARIFLGDSGSMFIGLVIGAVAIQGSFKAPATAALAAPLAVLAIPIFDGMAAVIRRRLSGQAVYTPDRGHIHHCLQRRGWTNRQILLGVGALCAATGFAVLLGLYFRSEPLALGATLAVVIGCVVAKIFGNYEYMLLVGTPRTKWKAMRGSWQMETSRVLGVCTRLRQCRTPEEIWNSLRQAADDFHLAGIQWELATSALPFKGAWHQTTNAQDPLWHLVLPLRADAMSLGELRVWGHLASRAVLPDLIGITMVAEVLAEMSKTFRTSKSEPETLSDIELRIPGLRGDASRRKSA